jgi:hypothetical protein
MARQNHPDGATSRTAAYKAGAAARMGPHRRQMERVNARQPRGEEKYTAETRPYKTPRKRGV